ncbi:MAG: lamin tail domain-containing protein [Bacteroidota bacterium]
MKRMILLWVIAAFLTGQSQAQLVINEIMYNPPGEDSLEYVEIFNNGNAAENLSNYSLTSRFVRFTFPNVSVGPGNYLIATKDSSVMKNLFGDTRTYYQWQSGNLTNTSDTIVLKNAIQQTVDSVRYGDRSPWPQQADNAGASLVLCDVNTDNTVAENWKAATTTASFQLNGVDIFANPGEASLCTDNPIVGFLGGGATVNEEDGILMIGVTIEDGNASQTQVTVGVRTSESTAVVNADFVLTSALVVFQAGLAKDTQFVTLQLIDDMMPERIEDLVLELVSPTNNARISPSADTYELTIFDDEPLLTKHLVISGVYDAQPLSGSFGTRGVELYALEDIPDLSVFGIASANNGTGGGTIESSLPALSLSQGSCYYIAQDDAKFLQFFGFEPNQTEGMTMSINGDDAIELYENGEIIDVFGDVNTDGTGQPWEYTDGWAYRVNGTGPDSSNFDIDHWIFSGVDALDFEATNNGAAIPFPSCSYSTTFSNVPVARDDVAFVDINSQVLIDVLLNDQSVNGVRSISITQPASNGSATVGLDNSILYQPGQDFCGSDMLNYELCDTLGSCDTALVSITVNCPIPNLPISVVRADSNNDFIPDSVNMTYEVRGIVYGTDLRGGPGLQFTVIDTSAGIAVFSFNYMDYDAVEGDSIHIIGRITEFNGLAQIIPDTIILQSANNDLVIPRVVTALGEETESQLIRIENVTLVDPAEWDNTIPSNESGMNIRVTNGQDNYTMRIDNDVDLYNMPAPVGAFDLTGIGGQFDEEEVPDSFYQIVPRYMEDIKLLVSTKEVWDLPISLYPNPSKDLLNISAPVEADVIRIYNLLGQPMKEIRRPGLNPRIRLDGLPDGMYWMSYQKGDQQLSRKFSILH